MQKKIQRYFETNMDIYKSIYRLVFTNDDNIQADQRDCNHLRLSLLWNESMSGQKEKKWLEMKTKNLFMLYWRRQDTCWPDKFPTGWKHEETKESFRPIPDTNSAELKCAGFLLRCHCYTKSINLLTTQHSSYDDSQQRDNDDNLQERRGEQTTD